jgi:Ran-binding protein 3
MFVLSTGTNVDFFLRPSAAQETSKNGSTASDNETGERPVRRKLKETRITSETNADVTSGDGDGSGNSSDDSGGDRGRLRKKRSLEDIQVEEEDASAPETESAHRRKRSRDSQDGDDDVGPSTTHNNVRAGTPEAPSRNEDDAARQILSPKKKRSLDQLERDESLPSGVEDGQRAATERENQLKVEGEREAKRHRDASQERRESRGTDTGQVKVSPIKSGECLFSLFETNGSQPSLPSAFLNTSAVSPFASLSGSRSPEDKDPSSKSPLTTSSSAFASSGLASFAGSDQSPFGALGSTASAPSVFKTASGTSGEKPASAGFAAASGPSPFANTGASTGFASLGSGIGGSGGFGSGFASAGTIGSGLTSFASPGSSSVLKSSSQVKPFGASGDGSDEENNEKEDEPVVAGFEKEKEDERFFEQQSKFPTKPTSIKFLSKKWYLAETGEEEEKTYFSGKAKLFHFTDGEWKERGVGSFKVNVKEPEYPDKGKLSARMIMRADGVLRVMLNSPLVKGMPVGDVSGAEPKGKQLNLASVEEGHTVPLLLRVSTISNLSWGIHFD